MPWDFASFPEYLASVGRLPLGLNFTAYVGHTALRLYVMGDDAYERAATADEVDAHVHRAAPRPWTPAPPASPPAWPPPTGARRASPCRPGFAERSELEALFAVVGAAGRGVVEVTPGTDDVAR